jgi:hypothetical protein
MLFESQQNDSRAIDGSSFMTTLKWFFVALLILLAADWVIMSKAHWFYEQSVYQHSSESPDDMRRRYQICIAVLKGLNLAALCVAAIWLLLHFKHKHPKGA